MPEAWPAQKQDIDVVARKMRKQDVDELLFANLQKPFPALQISFAQSTQCWTVWCDGEPSTMFGVVPFNDLTRDGIAWFLSTDKILEHKIIFLRSAEHYVQNLKIGYNRLMNYVHEGNTVSIEWLKWIGAEFADQPVQGPLGHNFYKFEM